MFPKMNMHAGLCCVFVIAVCALSARYGRERRRTNGRVTPRDVLLVMGVTWAAGWGMVALPVIFEWGRQLDTDGAVSEALTFLGIASAPLALILAASALSNLNRNASKQKKPTFRHPLD